MRGENSCKRIEESLGSSHQLANRLLMQSERLHSDVSHAHIFNAAPTQYNTPNEYTERRIIGKQEKLSYVHLHNEDWLRQSS